MFHSRPDAPKPRMDARPEIYEMLLHIRRRLFYVGLLTGHIQSALCLWWSFSYDMPAGRVEKEMILRCLDDERSAALSPLEQILVQAVKADAKGNAKEARANFERVGISAVAEYELLWKRRNEYLFAVDEEKALFHIWIGLAAFPAPIVIHSLKQLLAYTKDERLKIRIEIYLMTLNRNRSVKTIAQSYERIGDIMMAREYYEAAAATGDKEGLAWMREYLGKMAKESWFRRRMYYKQLEVWKKLEHSDDDKSVNVLP